MYVVRQGEAGVFNQFWLIAAPIVVWLGVFTYTVMLERRLAAVEASVGNDDL